MFAIVLDLVPALVLASLLKTRLMGAYLWNDPTSKITPFTGIKGVDESSLVTDLSAPLMYHDPSDLGSLFLIQITPRERTLKQSTP